jgi:hypothetical protein
MLANAIQEEIDGKRTIFHIKHAKKGGVEEDHGRALVYCTFTLSCRRVCSQALSYGWS